MLGIGGRTNSRAAESLLSMRLAACARRQIGDRDAADQEGRQLLRRQFVQPGTDERRVPMPTAFAVIRRSSTNLRASRILERLRQQVVQLEHLDAALLHLQHEVVVILLRLVHPDHVVEQQVVAIAGRQALMGERWPADHHGSQLADLRVNAELSHDSPPCI